MDLNGKSTGEVIPVKNPKLNPSKSENLSRNSENFHPNTKSPGLKYSNSPFPSIKSYSPNGIPPIKEKIQERKFFIAKKNSKREKVNSSTNVVCNCDSKANGKPFKCGCVFYETLRASQDEFFKNSSTHVDEDEKGSKKCDISETGVESNEEIKNHDPEKQALNEKEGSREMGDSDFSSKRRTDKLMEDARECFPETGSERVMHLVKAFENLLTLPKSKDSKENDMDEGEKVKKGLKWALPRLRTSLDLETQVSSSSFCPSASLLTSESLDLSCSLDSSQESISSRTSSGRRRSRHNSVESSVAFARRHRRRRQLRATSQKPFKLRTEQRGRYKQEEFITKVHQMMEEEKKQWIPIAQGLPWTTDEPECLVKPPVKESTKPIDLVLHSDIRAEERAEFDHQVAEKMSLIEQYRMERERQKKLAEEEEIGRLRRKELLPKAQPMPCFDRPFIPRRSMKQPTMPREPKFHIPQHKRFNCCISWGDLSCNE